MNSSSYNGYISEQRFILRAMENGLEVSKPITNAERYDFVVKGENGFKSIQVKKSYRDNKKRNVASLRSRYPGSTLRHALSDDVDYLVIDCREEDCFYIIPTEEIKHIKSNICVSGNGNYGKYKSNWNI